MRMLGDVPLLHRELMPWNRDDRFEQNMRFVGNSAHATRHPLPAAEWRSVSAQASGGTGRHAGEAA
jgi:hypothetical protein